MLFEFGFEINLHFLLLQRADLGLGGMTITHERERDVDFTKPFLTLGITILYRKPKPKPPDLFSFLSPLSIEVRTVVCSEIQVVLN